MIRLERQHLSHFPSASLPKEIGKFSSFRMLIFGFHVPLRQTRGLSRVRPFLNTNISIGFVPDQTLLTNWSNSLTLSKQMDCDTAQVTIATARSNSDASRIVRKVQLEGSATQRVQLKGTQESAGINRIGVGNERVLQRRFSQSLWP